MSWREDQKDQKSGFLLLPGTARSISFKLRIIE